MLMGIGLIKEVYIRKSLSLLPAWFGIDVLVNDIIVSYDMQQL